MEYKFSTTDQLENMSLPDDAVEVRGFVYEVGATSIVGKDKNLQLFKFILSNGDKKLPCLIWHKIESKQVNLIEKFKDVIIKDQILYIKGAAGKRTEFARHGSLKMELNINEGTVITPKGMYTIATPTIGPKDVDFLSILNEAEVRIKITGFLKIKFSLRTHRYKLGSYGLGVITDGQYKINVTIARYVDAELDIEEGATVTVTGVAKVVEDGTITVACDSSNDILVNEEADLMDEDFLFNGCKTPKRRRIANE